MTSSEDRLAPERLVAGDVLARNTVLNFVGQAAPVLAAVLAAPLLLSRLGTARFGLLSLIWVLIGYLNVFDLGFGRALTQLVAERLARDRSNDEVASLLWTYLALTVVIGAAAAAVVVVASGWIVGQALEVPAPLQAETLAAFVLMGASLPLVVSTPGLRGCLEAYQRFDLVTAVRVPTNIATVLGPVCVLPFSTSLVPVTAVLVGSRFVAWVAHMALCARVVRGFARPQAARPHLVRAMAGNAGWMAVSNVVAPVMAYFDRFVIAALVSAAAVAYYATPYDVVTKLSIVPLAITGVLFPAFATAFGLDRQRAALLFTLGTKYTFLLILPPLLVVAAFAHEALTAWLGAEFAGKATSVLELMALGVLLNSLAQVPFGLIQGVGRPALTAKLHLIEIPPYLALLWLVVPRYGIEGAAFAWVVRVLVDTALLFLVAGRILGMPGADLRLMGLAGVGGVAALAAASMMPFGPPLKGVLVSTTVAVFALTTWRRWLSSTEKVSLRRSLAPLARP